MNIARYRILVGFWAAAALALTLVGAAYLRQFARIDPFASYRARPEDMGRTRVAIVLRDVRLRQYEGPKMIGDAHVDRIEVTRDRQLINCFAITDGKYFADNKKSFQFSTDLAQYSFATKLLEAQIGARVISTDLDLKTSRFTYNQFLHELRIPGEVKGRFFDGQVVASDLIYRLNPASYELGSTTWEGKLQVEGDSQPSKRPWKIRSDHMKHPPGDIDIYTNAEATDGDVVVRADSVERNSKTDVLVGKGHVRYFSARSNLMCDKVTIYRKEKRAVLESGVQLFIKPESQEKLEVVELQPVRPVVPEEIAKGRPAPPSSDADKQLYEEVRSTKNRRKYPTTVLASRIEYWYGKGNRHAIITGSPQARQELPAGRWRQVWGHRALYDGEKETLRVDSSEGKKDTRIRTSLGDDLVATWFLVSTKEDEDSWEGEGVQGDVYPDEEEIPKENVKPPKARVKKPPPLKGPIGGG